jgi:hypothetical protein
MISIQEAIRSAIEFAEQLYPSEKLQDMEIEEIESSDDDQLWLVTLGWQGKPEESFKPSGGGFGGGGFGAALLGRTRRIYKIFTIDAETGEVISMKMRE